MGNYYTTFYNPDGTVKKAMPTFGQLQGTTFSPAEQKMYKKIWGEDFYNKNVSGSGQFVGASAALAEGKLTTPTINLAGTDQYGNTIGANGQITKLAAPKAELAPRSTVGTTGGVGGGGKKGSFFNSQTGADIIGAGISALGSIGGALIESHALDKLKATPHQYTLINPVKLKTKVNIGPQVATMRDTVAKVTDAARRTSASSRNAYQKIADARLAGARQISAMYGEKENKETALINQDRMNQQQVGMTNAQNVMNTINGNIDRRDNIENTKTIGKANAWINAINNISGSTVGPTGLMARHEARRSQAANLSMMALAHPDAVKLMQGDSWTKHFSGFYDMLNKRYWG